MDSDILVSAKNILYAIVIFFVVTFTLLYLYGYKLPVFAKTWLRENFDIDIDVDVDIDSKPDAIEKFTENSKGIRPVGKLASYPVVEFDTYNYLNRDNYDGYSNDADNDAPGGSVIVMRNTQELPVLSMTIYQQDGSGTYLDAVYNYMRRNIYPVKAYLSSSSINTINKLISGDIDIAFVNEEILTRYIKRDCKYLNRMMDRMIDNNSANKYSPINFSAIGMGYYQDFYLIVSESSNILQPVDLLKGTPKVLGIWYDSIYSFIKLFALYGFEISIDSASENSDSSTINLRMINNNVLTIKVFNNVSEMFNEFRDNRLTAVFIIEHPKDKPLEQLATSMRIRLIHLQPHITFATYTNISTSQDEKNKRAKIEETGVKNKYNLDKAEFNSLVRKTFQWIFPRVIDLNRFKLPTLNTYTYLETYSTRMILVARNDIKSDIISYLAKNYITGLETMRTGIDRELYTYKLANYSVNDFQWGELISFDNSIPLHSAVRDIYLKEGLLKNE